MNYDKFSSKQNEDMDPNYIYPRPYIDPTMYMNPYTMNGTPFQNVQMDPNMASNGYMTYMNPYMNNPMMGQSPVKEDNDDSNYEYIDESFYADMTNPGMMMPDGMPMMPPPGMMPGMMMPGGMPMMPPPGMMPGMMMPGGMPMMPPPGMMPGMMMPWMMSPYMMMPGMPQIHMEEFDEEEM
ncbi:MAG: hypothetical protein RR942_16005 [Romboutsia sp.]